MRKNSGVRPETLIPFNVFAASFCFVFIIEYSAGYLNDFNIVSELTLVGLARVIEAMGLLALIQFYGNGIATIGFISTQLFKGLKRGVLWSLSTGVVTGIGFIILYSLGINPFDLFKSGIRSDVYSRIAFFIIGGVIAPFAEEIFFRGIIFQYFRRAGFFSAVIISTLLFAVLHIPGSGIPITQMIGGLLFAFSYEVEKNLIVPIIIHISANLAIFTLSIL